MFSQPPFLAAIFILTVLFNWVIPLAIYTSQFGLFKKRPAGFIGCNAWGFVMDVVLAGTINLSIGHLLFSISTPFQWPNFWATITAGIIFTVILHVLMAATHWREWIMPRPWHWNLAGHWHMFSMTVQMAYAFYPLVLFAKDTSLLALPITQQTLLAVIVSSLLFLLSLAHKNKTVKIGPVVISGKPW